MNILYITKKWPKRNTNSLRDLCFGTCQTMINIGHKVHVASLDLQPAQKDDQGFHPLNLIDINPKKIQMSLQNIKVKPNLIIFNDFQIENTFSAYFYNRYNKIPKVLEINQLPKLKKYRKNHVQEITRQSFVQPNDQMIPQNFNILDQIQVKAIERSDHLFIGNQFIQYALNKKYKPDFSTLITFGYPIKEYDYQKNNLEYRPFDIRKNFFFIGELNKQSTIYTIDTLINYVWPLIKNKIPQAQLHIYGSGINQKAKKRQYIGDGVKFKGFIKDIQQQLGKYKALLYPDHIGCGVKGKIIDSWFFHTPVVTTPIGAQGLFLQKINMKTSFSDKEASASTGFASQRYLTNQEKLMQKRIANYYQSNNFFDKDSTQLTFGGSFRNFNIYDFAQSAIKIYTNQSYWNSCMKNVHRSILRNYNQHQLQVTLTDFLNKLQFKSNLCRNDSMYKDAWKSYIKSKEYHDKAKGKYQ